MTRTQYLRYLAGLSGMIGNAISNEGQMVEIDDVGQSVDHKQVLNFTNDVRQRLLWIERAAFDVKEPKE